MATAAEIGKDVTLRFSAAPTDPSTCSVHIKWSNLRQNIDNMLVLLCPEESGDVIFLFVSLESAGDICDIPLHIDLASKTFTLYVYGMQKSQTNYVHNTYASAMRKLTWKNGVPKDSKWQINLEMHSIKQMSITSIQKKMSNDPFNVTIEHQIPSNSVMVKIPNNHMAMSQVQQEVLVVIKQIANKPQTEMFMKGTTSTSSINMPVDMLPPGQVTITMYVLEKVHLNNSVMIYKKSGSSVEIPFKWPSNMPNEMSTPTTTTPMRLPDMTKADLKTLMQKALTLIGKDKYMYVLTHLYRNKPPSYFNYILHRRWGIMEKYRKDFNGDPASCINGTIDGLFFSASLDRKTEKPPDFSYFGAQRLHIPAVVILNENTNMYFADFYCHNTCHYVTIVVTEARSDTDYFCRNKLLSLDPFDNPFIVKKYNHFLQRFVVHVTLSVLVEVFYTENVNIMALMTLFPFEVFFTKVVTRGRGESQLYGIPKNKDCSICGLK